MSGTRVSTLMAVMAVALSLSVVGCTEGTGPPQPTGSQSTPTPDPVSTDLRANCERVADDLISLSLLPAALELVGDSEDFEEIQATLYRMRREAPAELRPVYTELIEIVRVAGKHQMAPDVPLPSTPSPSPQTTESAGFDRAAFDSATNELKDWIGNNCAELD